MQSAVAPKYLNRLAIAMPNAQVIGGGPLAMADLTDPKRPNLYAVVAKLDPSRPSQLHRPRIEVLACWARVARPVLAIYLDRLAIAVPDAEVICVDAVRVATHSANAKASDLQAVVP